MFERYIEQARRAIFFARYEASCQSAEKISTAHLLLGLLREGASRAEAVGPLKDNEVQIRTALSIPISAVKPNKASLMRDLSLDDNSKKVLAYAAEESDFDKEYWIDTDHLLRGILRFPNEATNALESISLNLDEAREASKRNRAEFPSKSPPRFLFFHRHFALPFRKLRYSVETQIVLAITILLLLFLYRWINGMAPILYR
jgi:ATP-dependent Clp protease ATP-binding subunit ClpC